MNWQREDVKNDVYFDNGSGKRIEVAEADNNRWSIQLFDSAHSQLALENHTRESRKEALSLAEELMRSNLN